jgi:hypothetical protein
MINPLYNTFEKKEEVNLRKKQLCGMVTVEYGRKEMRA